MEAIETITRKELKEKMDRGDELVLLKTMGKDAYRKMHQRSYRTRERRS